MSIEIKVPNVGESVQEVQVAHWLKSEGDFVNEDESVVELETDKASLEVPAPASGVLSKIVKQAGDQVAVGDTLAYLDEKASPEKGGKAEAESGGEEPAEEPTAEQGGDNGKEKKSKKKRKKEKKKQRAKEKASQDEVEAGEESEEVEAEEVEGEEPVEVGESQAAGRERQTGGDGLRVTPSARRALREFGLKATDVEASGDRLRRSDVLRYVESREKAKEEEEKPRKEKPAQRPAPAGDDAMRHELEELVTMSLIRKRIAQRLVAARQEAALLTTFNEIDMSAVIRMRKDYGESFREKYGVKLGFMSFFVKASVEALKRFPEVNAEVLDGDKILYRRYYDIGIAIGGGKGLVVPVLRFAERMSFAEIEQAIADFGERAAQNKLEPEELQGGTFTISNGGVYGSLLSTPIVNPPQSGVLGMHAIEQRPVAREGQVVIRPMMYVALSYDHRIVDGREAVTFLKHIKDTIEEPARMLIEL